MNKKMKITSLVLSSAVGVVIPIIAVSTFLINQKNENKESQNVKNDVTNFAKLSNNDLIYNFGTKVDENQTTLNNLVTEIEKIHLIPNATGLSTFPTTFPTQGLTLTSLATYFSNVSKISSLLTNPDITQVYAISAPSDANGTATLSITLSLGSATAIATIKITGLNSYPKILASMKAKLEALKNISVIHEGLSTFPTLLPSTNIELPALSSFINTQNISSILNSGEAPSSLTSSFSFLDGDNIKGTASLIVSLTIGTTTIKAKISNINGFQTNTKYLNAIVTKLQSITLSVNTTGAETLVGNISKTDLNLDEITKYLDNTSQISKAIDMTSVSTIAVYSITNINNNVGTAKLSIALTLGDSTQTATISLSGFQTNQEFLETVAAQLNALSLSANNAGANLLPSAVISATSPNTFDTLSRYLDMSNIKTILENNNISNVVYSLISPNNLFGEISLQMTLTLGSASKVVTYSQISGFKSYKQKLSAKLDQFTASNFSISDLGSQTIAYQVITLYNQATTIAAKSAVIKQYINVQAIPELGQLESLPITSYYSLAQAPGGFSNGTLVVSINLSVDFSGTNQATTSNTSNIVAVSKSFDIKGFQVVAFYKPSSLTFQTNTANWNSDLYASQITSNQIKQLLDSALVNSNVSTPTNGVSGYQLQLAKNTSGGTTFINVTNTELGNLTDGFSIGDVANPSAFSRITIVINSYNNALGTINFSVIEQLQPYENQNGFINPSKNTEVNGLQVQSIILPPTQYASSTNSNEWVLPSMFGMKKLSYNFAWNSNKQIGNFISNFTTIPAAITNADISNNFFTLTPSINDPNEIFNPNFSIVLKPANNDGYIQVTIIFSTTAINPALVYMNGSAITQVTRYFYGFKTLSTTILPAAKIILNMPTNAQLLSAIVTQGYWSTSSTTEGSPGAQGTEISKMLPSLFVNPPQSPVSNNAFLSIFTGATAGLSITNSAGHVVDYIGSLSYLGQSSGHFTDFPSFNITQVDTFPNDQNGTLEIVVYYDQIGADGSVFVAPPVSVVYTGFQENPDSGKTLSFSWLSSIPTQYATMSAIQIADLYKELTNQTIATIPNASKTLIVKNFIAKFFTASSDTMNLYLKEAIVLLVLSPLNSNQIQITVSFPSYNGASFNTQTSYIISGIIEAKPASTISLVQKYLSPLTNPLAKTLPSKLSIKDFEKMITITTLNPYTSNFGDGGVTIFSVPNDKLGEVYVTYIFKQFNGIDNYTYSQLFVGFEENILLSTNLIIPYISNVNLPSSFLALNPEDTSSFTSQTILLALPIFNNSNILLKNIITAKNIIITARTQTSVNFTFSINWQNLINPSTVQNQSLATTPSATNPADEIKMEFTINGFYGGSSILDNQSPHPKIIPNNTLAYGLGIGLSLSAVLVIILVVTLILNRKKVN